MNIFDLLSNMRYLCDTHDIEFGINKWGLFITKYYYYCGKLFKYSQSFSFDLFEYVDIEDCVLEFERRLEEEIARRKNSED